MKKITLLLIVLFCQFSLSAQVDYKQQSTAPGANYYDIVNNTRAYFQNLKSKSAFALSSKKQEKQFERWVYFWKDRIGTDGKFPSATLGYYNAGIINAQGKILPVKKQKIQAESWINIGPQVNPAPNGYANPPQLGRLNTFLRIKHPTDRNMDVLFVGAPSGGVWKSTDNGTTWSPKLDIIAGIGVTDIQTAATTTLQTIQQNQFMSLQVIAMVKISNQLEFLNLQMEEKHLFLQDCQMRFLMKLKLVIWSF